ncbi:hypothetical protein QJQ45_018659, partial [Haematococcus lacustris]
SRSSLRASEPGPSTPPPAKRTEAEQAADPTRGKGKGKAAKAKPASQPGRWLDRDCNAALNMQRIGVSRWRPLELCYWWWPDQTALPARGKEYPGLGYKRKYFLKLEAKRLSDKDGPASSDPVNSVAISRGARCRSTQQQEQQEQQQQQQLQETSGPACRAPAARLASGPLSATLVSSAAPRADGLLTPAPAPGPGSTRMGTTCTPHGHLPLAPPTSCPDPAATAPLSLQPCDPPAPQSLAAIITANLTANLQRGAAHQLALMPDLHLASSKQQMDVAVVAHTAAAAAAAAAAGVIAAAGRAVHRRLLGPRSASDPPLPFLGADLWQLVKLPGSCLELASIADLLLQWHGQQHPAWQQQAQQGQQGQQLQEEEEKEQQEEQQQQQQEQQEEQEEQQQQGSSEHGAPGLPAHTLTPSATHLLPPGRQQEQERQQQEQQQEHRVEEQLEQQQQQEGWAKEVPQLAEQSLPGTAVLPVAASHVQGRPGQLPAAAAAAGPTSSDSTPPEATPSGPVQFSLQFRARIFESGHFQVYTTSDERNKTQQGRSNCVQEQQLQASVHEQQQQQAAVQEQQQQAGGRVLQCTCVKQLCTLGKKLSVKMLNEYCKAVGLYVPANTLRADLRRAAQAMQWECVLTKEQLKHNPTAPSLPKLPSLTGAGKRFSLQGTPLSPTLLPMSIVDEHRTSRVSSAVNGQQPCERQLNKRRATRPAGWQPPAGQVEQRLVRPAWSQQRDQPVRGMMSCPVVAPRKPPQAPRSSQEATQAAASEPGPSTPLPAKRSKRTKAEPAAEPTNGKGKGKAAKAKPAPQPGRWLDRDCNAALNMQRIGESKWRPLELCYWPE